MIAIFTAVYTILGRSRGSIGVGSFHFLRIESREPHVDLVAGRSKVEMHWVKLEAADRATVMTIPSAEELSICAVLAANRPIISTS